MRGASKPFVINSEMTNFTKYSKILLSFAANVRVTIRSRYLAVVDPQAKRLRACAPCNGVSNCSGSMSVRAREAAFPGTAGRDSALVRATIGLHPGGA